MSNQLIIINMKNLCSISAFMHEVNENNLLTKNNFIGISGGNQTSDYTYTCTDGNLAGCPTNSNRDARRWVDGVRTEIIESNCNELAKLEIKCP